MRITELKKSISQLLEVTDDKEALKVVFEILEDRYKSKDKDILDDLSESDLARLDKSIAEIERGEVVSHEVVMKRIRNLVKNGKTSKLV
jgi:predicted transcriptional regulator